MQNVPSAQSTVQQWKIHHPQVAATIFSWHRFLSIRAIPATLQWQTQYCKIVQRKCGSFIVWKCKLHCELYRMQYSLAKDAFGRGDVTYLQRRKFFTSTLSSWFMWSHFSWSTFYLKMENGRKISGVWESLVIPMEKFFWLGKSRVSFLWCKNGNWI